MKAIVLYHTVGMKWMNCIIPGHILDTFVETWKNGMKLRRWSNANISSNSSTLVYWCFCIITLQCFIQNNGYFLLMIL